MGQVLNASATTTEAVRRAIQHSQASLRELAKRYGINPKTVAKWKRRKSVSDLRTGPREPKSTVLTVEDEAVIVAFRRHTLLPLDDCLYSLQATIPHLTRSSLHRCLQRHGISRLPDVEGDKPTRKKFKSYPIGFFHLDIAEVQTAEGKLYLFVAIDRTSKFAFVQLVESANRVTASAFLVALIAAIPYKIHTILTDNGIQFRFAPRYADGPTARYMTHMFDMRCRENSIEHRFTKINHPWTNGQVERMNRTIKEATVKRYQLRHTRAAEVPPRKLRRRLQLRPTIEDPQGPDALRIHRQSMDKRAQKIQTRPNPPKAGTKHLGARPFDLHRDGPTATIRFLAQGQDVVGHCGHARFDPNGINQSRSSGLRHRTLRSEAPPRWLPLRPAGSRTDRWVCDSPMRSWRGICRRELRPRL